MFMQSLTDYLFSLQNETKTIQTNSFIHVGADEMPDVYLSAINEDEDSDDSVNWNDQAFSSGVSDNEDDCDEENGIDCEDDSAHLVRLALDVILQERRTVVLGNPGSGKTTLLQFVMHMMAQKLREDSLNADLPVYIPLKELSLSDSLSDRIGEFMRNPHFEPFFRKDRVFLFLDGLNEVQPSVYERTVLAIQEFMDSFPGCGLVLTSRLYGYSGQLELPSFLLEGFTDDNIQDYILKRTGNNELYKQICDHESLYGLAGNPLLLNMLVSIWITYGNIPDIRLHLYEQFIRYQLQKTGVVADNDRELIIDSLSKLAFTMRNYGFLSDSYAGMDSIISNWVEPDRVGEVTRMIVGCGLLSVTCKGTDFWCFSFIHETFQEYFSTLYIYREFYASGSLCVNLSLSEWRETLTLLAENLSLKGETGLLADFLGQVAGQFYRSSQTSFFNDRLDEMFLVLGGASMRCTLLRDWMAQYLVFNMNNFVQLPEDFRTLHRFEIVVKSVATLGSNDVNRLLFQSYRWLQYWLYDIERVEYVGEQMVNSPIRIMCRHLRNFAGREKIYTWLYHFSKKYGCFEIIANKQTGILKMKIKSK